MFGRLRGSGPRLAPGHHQCPCGEVYVPTIVQRCWVCESPIAYKLPDMTREEWPTSARCRHCRCTFTFPARRRALDYCSRDCRRAGRWAWLRRGGRYVGPGGYAYVKVDGTWRAEHVVVAERALGRPLHAREHVRHLDGNRSNNDPSNLMVRRKGGVRGVLLRT
jgi:hypothetical protein